MDIDVSRVGRHIEVWTLNRGEHNAFGESLLRELIEPNRRAREDDGVRVVITTGAGDSYAVGADLDRLAALDGAPDGRHTGLVHRIADDPLAEAVTMAERVCRQPPMAVAANLRLLRASGDTRLEDHLAREYRFQQVLWESDEFRTRVARMDARRRPTPDPEPPAGGLPR